MKYRPRWSLLGVGALIVLLLYSYPVWRKVLTARTGSTGSYPAANDGQRQVLDKLAKTDRGLAATAYSAMLTVVPAPTNEQPTPVLADAQAIYSAAFANLDELRQAAGSVVIYRSADGSLLLRFDNFSVTNAPQLTVYLTGSTQPLVPADLNSNGVSGFPVGLVKGTKGNQQFNIPKELNLAKYKSVVIFSDALQLIYAFAVFK
jgi:hypothetical protein